MFANITDYLWSFLTTNPSTAQVIRNGLDENINIIKDTLLDDDVIVNNDDLDLSETELKSKLKTESEIDIEIKSEPNPKKENGFVNWLECQNFELLQDGTMIFYTDQSSKLIFTSEFNNTQILDQEFKDIIKACEKLKRCRVTFAIDYDEDADAELSTESYGYKKIYNDNDSDSDINEQKNSNYLSYGLDESQKIIFLESKEKNLNDEELKLENTIPLETKIIHQSGSNSNTECYEKEVLKRKNSIMANVWKYNTIEKFLENNKDIVGEDLELVKNLYQSDKESREAFLLQNSFFEA